jgi:Na+/H+ antiporter NhaC
MKDYGPMYNAEVRARTEGLLLRDGAEPLSATDTEVLTAGRRHPAALVQLCYSNCRYHCGNIYRPLYAGGGPKLGLMEAFGDADSSVVLLWASSLGALVTLIMVLVQRIVPLQEAIDTIINGAKSVFPALIILVLAWALSYISGELGAADYLVNLVERSGIRQLSCPC